MASVTPDPTLSVFSACSQRVPQVSANIDPTQIVLGFLKKTNALHQTDRTIGNLNTRWNSTMLKPTRTDASSLVKIPLSGLKRLSKIYTNGLKSGSVWLKTAKKVDVVGSAQNHQVGCLVDLVKESRNSEADSLR